MNIAKFCIRHKVTTLLAVIMIAVFGVVYTTQLQMALLPNIEYPAAYVYCYYNGAGPEDIEQLVTRPLESAIMSVPGVDSVTSSSADSISTIQIMYVENTDVDIAATKLREKFDALSLPDGCGVKIELEKLKTPPVFDLLAKAGDIPQHDMFNTYNMGVGMSIIVSPDKADEAVRTLIAAGEDAYIMGEVTKGEGVELC